MQQVLIDKLGLVPHPEGGFFKETFRSGAEPMASKGKTDPAGSLTVEAEHRPARNELTSIYYMLTNDAPKQWLAANKSPHVHYWHAGAAIQYRWLEDDGVLREVVLGPDVTAGQVMQLPAPGGCFKCAHMIASDEHDFALVGEAVSPGFDFRDFNFVSTVDIDNRMGGRDAGEVMETLAPFVNPELTCDTDAYYKEE